jgi:hypothetical protein
MKKAAIFAAFFVSVLVASACTGPDLLSLQAMRSEPSALGAPREPSEVWTIRPRRGHRQDVDAFSTEQGRPVEKPGQTSRSEGRRTRGVVSLVIFLYSGPAALRPSGRLKPFALRAWTSKESNSRAGRRAKHAAGDFLAEAQNQSDARSSDNPPPKPLDPGLRRDDDVGGVARIFRYWRLARTPGQRDTCSRDNQKPKPLGPGLRRDDDAGGVARIFRYWRLARTPGQSDTRSGDNQKPKPLGPGLRRDDDVGGVTRIFRHWRLARTPGRSDTRSRDNQKPKPLGSGLRRDDDVGGVARIFRH